MPHPRKSIAIGVYTRGRPRDSRAHNRKNECGSRCEATQCAVLNSGLSDTLERLTISGLARIAIRAPGPHVREKTNINESE